MAKRCPECLARERESKEDTAKRTRIDKLLDDSPALEERIKNLKTILIKSKYIHRCTSETKFEGGAFCCALGKLIEQGIAL